MGLLIMFEPIALWEMHFSQPLLLLKPAQILVLEITTRTLFFGLVIHATITVTFATADLRTNVPIALNIITYNPALTNAS